METKRNQLRGVLFKNNVYLTWFVLSQESKWWKIYKYKTVLHFTVFNSLISRYIFSSDSYKCYDFFFTEMLGIFIGALLTGVLSYLFTKWIRQLRKRCQMGATGRRLVEAVTQTPPTEGRTRLNRSLSFLLFNMCFFSIDISLVNIVYDVFL